MKAIEFLKSHNYKECEDDRFHKWERVVTGVDFKNYTFRIRVTSKLEKKLYNSSYAAKARLDDGITFGAGFTPFYGDDLAKLEADMFNDIAIAAEKNNRSNDKN